LEVLKMVKILKMIALNLLTILTIFRVLRTGPAGEIGCHGAWDDRAGRVRSVLLPVVLLIGMGSCCCLWPWDIGLAYEDDLVADYAVWAVDSRDSAAIVRKTSPRGATSVIGGISVYGWNNDFILAKTDFRTWYIIEVAGGKVHGPLTREQYAELRETLGVPPDLTFTRNVFVSDED